MRRVLHGFRHEYTTLKFFMLSSDDNGLFEGTRLPGLGERGDALADELEDVCEAEETKPPQCLRSSFRD